MADRVKLTEAQKRGLEFLANTPWVSPWWGGKPHAGWPKELNERSHDKLISLGLIGWVNGGNYLRKVMITPAGRALLASNAKGE